MASVIWTEGPSGFSSGDTPNPASRPARGRRRWLALTAAGLLVGAAGFTQGASTAIGIDGVRALAGDGLESTPTTRVHRRDHLGGSFWAPAGSSAQPPEHPLQGRHWTPAADLAAPAEGATARLFAREAALRSTSGSEAADDLTPGDHR